MTRSRLAFACLGLVLGLLFYVAYRSDQTLSNRFVRHVVGPTNYVHFKHDLRLLLPVPLFLRGSLPSLLWCFIVTSLVGGWSIQLPSDRTILLAWLAPFFNAVWEIVQWLGWTDGRADWQDAGAGFAGWLLAQAIFHRQPVATAALFMRIPWRVGVVVAAFACMGLADVWK